MSSRPPVAELPISGDPLIGDLRRAGLLPLLVLHYISIEACYGNQLMERIGELTGGALAVNPNTMYPLLRQLEGRGLIKGEWEHPERRSRRYYSLTAKGRTEYARLVEEVRPFLDSVKSSIDEIVQEVYGR
jgi:PadR family transcriptional regulator, regulatory protein PadR